MQEVFPFFEAYTGSLALVRYCDSVPEIDELTRGTSPDMNNKSVLRFKKQTMAGTVMDSAFHLYALNELGVLGKRKRGEEEEDERGSPFAAEENSVSLESATKYRYVREYRYSLQNEASQQNCFLFFPSGH